MAAEQQGASRGPATVPWGQGAEDAPSGGGGVFTRLPKNAEAGESIVVRVLTSQMRYQARNCRVQGRGGRVGYRTLAEPADPREAEGLYAAVDGTPFLQCEARTRYRTLVWNHTTQALEVMEYGPLIFGVITGLCNDEDWGGPDPNAPPWTLNPLGYDVKVKAIPSDSPNISHSYEVFTTAKGHYALAQEVLQKIADKWADVFARLNPYPGREALAKTLGMQTGQAPAPPQAQWQQQAPPAAPPQAPAAPLMPPAMPPMPPAPPPMPPAAVPQQQAVPQVPYTPPPPPPPPPFGPGAAGAPQPYDPTRPPFGPPQ